MKRFPGIIVPLVTPFKNGELDLPAARSLTSFLIDQGVHGLVVCGTTGEGSSLSEEEKIALAGAVIRAAGRRVPVLMGLCGSNTRMMAREAKIFETTGVDGYLVSAPAYVRPSQAGILAHFREIAAATSLPIVIYNIPARTGVNIEPATVIELAASSQFVAVKECAGNVAQLRELIHNAPCAVLCGDDALLLTTLALGGHGAISASAHIRPDLFARVYALSRIQHEEEARAVFGQLKPIIHLLFTEPNPAPLKSALAMQGWLTNELRLPMMPASRQCETRIYFTLDELNALDPKTPLNGVHTHAA